MGAIIRRASTRRTCGVGDIRVGTPPSGQSSSRRRPQAAPGRMIEQAERGPGTGCVLRADDPCGFPQRSGTRLHYNGLLSRLDVGVAIFYVISGFLLFRPHAEGWFWGSARPAAPRYLSAPGPTDLPSALAGHHRRGTPAREAGPVMVGLRETRIADPDLHGRQRGTGSDTDLEPCHGDGLLPHPPALAWVLTRGRPTRAAARARVSVLVGGCAVGAAWMAATATHAGSQMALWLPGYLGWFGVGMALALWQVARAHGTFSRTWVEAQPRTIRERCGVSRWPCTWC